MIHNRGRGEGFTCAIDARCLHCCGWMPGRCLEGSHCLPLQTPAQQVTVDWPGLGLLTFSMHPHSLHRRKEALQAQVTELTWKSLS